MSMTRKPGLDVLVAPTAAATLSEAAPFDGATLAAIAETLSEGESANTRASYASALRYWMAWWELRIAPRRGIERAFDPDLDLPFPPGVIVQFIVDHARRRTQDSTLQHELPADIDRQLVAAGVKGKSGAMSLNTLKHRLAACARLHRTKSRESPTDHEDVRRLMKAVRAGHAQRHERPKGKAPLLAEHMQKLLATCDTSPQGVRDRALLLFAFASGGRRRSEVAQADMSNLLPSGKGFRYFLGYSKTNRTGEETEDSYKPVQGQAAEAMRAWLALLAAAGIKDGAIFRRVRGRKIDPAPLSDRSVWNIVATRCAAAGLEGDFSAHSLRAGFMTEAVKKVDIREAMKFSGHTDVKTAMTYVRGLDMERSAAARLLDPEDGPAGECS